MSETISETFELSVHDEHVRERREEYTSRERVRYQVEQQLL